MSGPYENGKPIVLIAEDDIDDKLLLEMSFRGFENSLELKFVNDGDELMDFLSNHGRSAPLGLILLDLNMPKIDGRQAMLEIKGRTDLKDIPIVIWTTSNEEEDKVFCAKAGAAGYVTKPTDFLELNAAIKRIVETWLCVFPAA